jgi:hypothetical protein
MLNRIGSAQPEPAQQDRHDIFGPLMKYRPTALQRLYDLIDQDQRHQKNGIGPHLAGQLPPGESSDVMRPRQHA